MIFRRSAFKRQSQKADVATAPIPNLCGSRERPHAGYSMKHRLTTGTYDNLLGCFRESERWKLPLSARHRSAA
jgi:hypothetical protein